MNVNAIQENYAVVSNYHLKDKRLSNGAKGLMTYLLATYGTGVVDFKKAIGASCDSEDEIARCCMELTDWKYVVKVNNVKDEKPMFYLLAVPIDEEREE